MPKLYRLQRAALYAAVFGTTVAIVSTASAEEIIIGAATAQTGGLAPYDQPALAGLRMALDELNAKGGLAGKYTVKLIIKDTRSDTAQTATVAQELIDAGAKIMITPCDADPSISAGQLTQPLGIPTLTLCGSAPVLTAAVGDVMFGTYPADNVQATAVADFAVAEGKKKVFLLTSPDSTYTANLPEYFGKVFEKKGGAVVGRGTFTMGQPDFSAEITNIKSLADQPDLIMTAAYEPDFPAFIQQLRGAGVTIPVYGADAIGTPTIKGLGKLVDGVVYTAAGYAEPGSKLEAFNAAFAKYAGHAPESTYEVNGYEIGLILDQAVKTAGSDDPKAIRDAIAGLKDFDGITGKITYAGTDRMPLRPVALMRYESGEGKHIQTMIPDAADVPAP
ncbi:MAG: ABC transporter substrate-binding protein [Mesorhizobium sp.]|uniref:ABC transporter substrate-binding protein n=1 Tax=unclassified Mesorhizobium TaxID=325217 RepID=UPI000FD31929|nr:MULTISPECIES: ABC transporter substrate-binding protein [unclassified Mesorhizobium]RUV01764.1 ABC transporter substrate-binding protein [Mesorhizobium sp. M6A.T.Cr.TU.017.01.1.1]RWN68668.1 MAG: ABC transporter substrate-binding protein [Mesorhizobium sp.]RWP72651.1 MAG: ABC transporter substrate-binding protein [Mesorhizobium sp.]